MFFGYLRIKQTFIIKCATYFVGERKKDRLKKMRKEDLNFLKIGEKYCRVKIVGGGVQNVKIVSLVGYCHCLEHTGYITVNILEKHDCINKKCLRLEKFENYPFWENRKRQQLAKENRKREIRIEAKEKVRLLKEIKEEACRWVEQLKYPILIININEIAPQKYIIYFVSESAVNDSFLYWDIGVKLHDRFSGKFRVQRIKKSDGTYAGLSDFSVKK